MADSDHEPKLGASLSARAAASQPITGLVESEQARGIVAFLAFAGLGAIVGVLVAALEWLTIEGILHQVIAGPLWLRVAGPALGLLAAFIIRHGFKQHETATSDAYVATFHSGTTTEPKSMLTRLAGSVATIGGGGAVGLEGPSVLLGSSLGQWLGKRWPRMVGPRSDRILLAAGAAAGVAAVFKAPATGVLFALEAPYRRDIARHALIPALVASATAYLAFVLLLGNEKLLNLRPAELSLNDEVGGAIVLGLASGLVAKLLVKLFHAAKMAPKRYRIRWRLPIAAGLLAATVFATEQLVDAPIGLGPGAEAAAEVVLDAHISVWVILGLFGLRAIATSATLGGSGVGGVFIPLAVQGLLLGKLVETLFDAPANGLYPVVGLAAVLGAGYRTPLAAVMFVAETTGRAEFVIPALLATAIAQALMGEQTVSLDQISERRGTLEQRLVLPVKAVAIGDVATVSPDESLLDVVDRLGTNPPPAVPVITEGGYAGLLVLHDIAGAMFSTGIDAMVGDCMRDVATVAPDDPAIKAAKLMNESDTAAIAIVDENGVSHGIVSAVSLTGLRTLEHDVVDDAAF